MLPGDRRLTAHACDRKAADLGRILARARAVAWVQTLKPIWRAPVRAVSLARGVQKTGRWRFFWRRRV
jgi:hypothetical protein